MRLEIASFFADRKRNDLLLLYFSGHGIKDDDGRLYLATADTRRRLLRATAVPATFVNETMTASRSRRQVLILDCCHSGAFARTKADRVMGIQERLGGRGRVVLTSSDAVQYSFEGDEVAGEGVRSVFTRVLVQGLETGDADRDRDGYVSLDELYEYVYDRVVDETPKQRPQMFATVEGKIVIARNPRPVVTEPVELPGELLQAIESPFAGVRAGAVDELDHLLRGSHPGLALAAREALARLVNDDSRRVSTAATGRLETYARIGQEAQAAKEREREGRERSAREQAEAERAAREKAEQERLAREKAERERVAAQKAEAERAAREKVEQERLAREKAERERVAAQKAETERAAREKAEQERLAREKAERERQARLAQLYDQASTALQGKRWEDARRLCADIEALEPGYRDVGALLKQAEAEIRQEREAQFWSTQAREPSPRPQRGPVPGWAVGGLALVMLLIGLGGWAAGWWSEPTETPTRQPTDIPSLATEVPTEAPTATLSLEPMREVSPTLRFDAQVGIAASVTELRPGEPVTVTVTITNTGGVPFGSLRYQLMGWEPYLAVTTEVLVEHELDLAPNQSDTAIFVLEAVQVGTTSLQANVTVKTQEDPAAIKPVSSEPAEISIIQ